MAVPPRRLAPQEHVWRYYDQWRSDGTLDTIHDRLRPQGPAKEKPYHPRTTASVDSQSVDTTSGGQQRARDNANVDGQTPYRRGQHGWPGRLVTAASVDDAAAAPELFARLAGQPMGKVRRMYADNKYHNFALYEWVETNAGWGLEIIRRPKGQRGWVRLPIRWTVERRSRGWVGAGG